MRARSSPPAQATISIGDVSEPESGTFSFEISTDLLASEDIRLPDRGRIYSVNEGNFHFWSQGVKEYIQHIKAVDKASGRPYSSRYIGSMVADVHRTLFYGGIFMYPADNKNARKTTGKLRLLYENAPLAMVCEAAGTTANQLAPGPNNCIISPVPSVVLVTTAMLVPISVVDSNHSGFSNILSARRAPFEPLAAA